MDEQTIRRLMHQKRKDEYKVDVLKLKYELAKQKDTNKFLKIMQIVLIAKINMDRHIFLLGLWLSG
jgi:hypothetical protein